MKILVSYASAVASVLLVSGLFHSAPALADVCSAPGFASARAFEVGREPVSIVMSDFNSDGIPDLAVANNYSGGVSVLLGFGDGTFQTSINTGLAAAGYRLAAADFNSDGRPDLAVVDYGSGTASLLLGKGDGTFKTPVSYAVGTKPASVVSADLHGDGKSDL